MDQRSSANAMPVMSDDHTIEHPTLLYFFPFHLSLKSPLIEYTLHVTRKTVRGQIVIGTSNTEEESMISVETW